MTAVALALASSLSWGVADFMGGLQARRRPLLAVLVVTQAAGLTAVLVAAAVRAEGPPEAGAWIAWAAGSTLFGISGLAAFYRGLAIGAMGVVAPISAAAAIVPLTVGLATGDRPSPIQAAGVAVAIAGVVLAAREERAPGAKARAGVAAGAGLAIVAALGFGGFFVGIDRASEADVLWAIVVARAVSVAGLTTAVLATRTAVPRDASALRVLVPIGLLDTGANLLFAAATTHGLVSLVGVLGSLYPVVTVLLARFVLHERLHALQRVGAVAALAGAALISAG
jgi:drug/metabolite transporter (DMT)-like permease